MKKNTNRELENIMYISFYCLNLNLSNRNLQQEKLIKNQILETKSLYISRRILNNPVNNIEDNRLYNYHIFLQRFSFIYKKVNIEYSEKLTDDEIRLKALRSLEIIRNLL